MAFRRSGAASALALWVAFFFAEARHAGDQSRDGRVQPKLEPPSHKVFFKHDYPKDLSPKPMHEFDHPFPIVQDSEDYDKDYVKDENTDNGQWKLQEEYDHLRGRLAQAREAASKLQDKEFAKAQALRNAEASEKEARAKASAAQRSKEEAEARAAEKLKAAETKYDEAMQKKVGHHGVANQTKEVEKELQDIKDCQKELNEAREKLKRLQDERAQAEAAAKKAKATEDSAEDMAISDEKIEASEEEIVSQDERKFKSAQKKHESAEKKYLSTQEEFKQAEARLRKFRHQGAAGGEVGADGKQEAKSGASSRSTMWLIVALVAVAGLPLEQLLAEGH